jgi:antimicrobial peptide system SdpA family protein
MSDSREVLGGAVAGTVALAVMATLSVLSAIPTTAITPGAVERHRQHVGQLLPQGWAFFTRSMNQSDIAAYTGDLSQEITTTNSDSDNGLGISRAQRTEGPEISTLTQSVPAEGWTPCATFTDSLDNCERIRKSAVSTSLRNESPHPVLCGEVAFVKSEPVPWAWTTEHSRGRRVVAVSWADVRC